MKAVITRNDLPGLIIMAVLGLALSFLGLAKFKKASDAKKWPVIKGVVTKSEVGGNMKYYPSIDYSYTFDGVAYNSNSISNINFNTKNRSVAEDFIRKYPLGSEVMVYCNPLKPSEAYLEPGINSGNIVLLGFGFLLLAIPIFSVAFLKVDLKKKT